MTDNKHSDHFALRNQWLQNNETIYMYAWIFLTYVTVTFAGIPKEVNKP